MAEEDNAGCKTHRIFFCIQYVDSLCVAKADEETKSVKGSQNVRENEGAGESEGVSS